MRWVLLADPEAYGWDALATEGRAVWDGIANAVAQKHIQSMRAGDEALLYETAPAKAIRGVARIASDPYPDPAAAGRVVVDVEPLRPLDRPLTLAALKADPVLATLGFVRMPRVAVQPVTDEQWARVLEQGGAEER
jgi:predicted RNA-binding protein with PUA-like domain